MGPDFARVGAVTNGSDGEGSTWPVRPRLWPRSAVSVVFFTHDLKLLLTPVSAHWLSALNAPPSTISSERKGLFGAFQRRSAHSLTPPPATGDPQLLGLGVQTCMVFFPIEQRNSRTSLCALEVGGLGTDPANVLYSWNTPKSAISGSVARFRSGSDVRSYTMARVGQSGSWVSHQQRGWTLRIWLAAAWKSGNRHRVAKADDHAVLSTSWAASTVPTDLASSSR